MSVEAAIGRDEMPIATAAHSRVKRLSIHGATGNAKASEIPMARKSTAGSTGRRGNDAAARLGKTDEDADCTRLSVASPSVGDESDLGE
jgi:hypothetical protein